MCGRKVYPGESMYYRGIIIHIRLSPFLDQFGTLRPLFGAVRSTVEAKEAWASLPHDLNPSTNLLSRWMNRVGSLRIVALTLVALLPIPTAGLPLANASTVTGGA